MECSEFLSRFSDFYDAPPESPLRRQVKAHLEQCEKCARYERTVAGGAALLQTLPRIELSESFRPTLEHRLFTSKTRMRSSGPQELRPFQCSPPWAWPSSWRSSRGLRRSGAQRSKWTWPPSSSPIPAPRTCLPCPHREIHAEGAGSGSAEGTLGGPHRAALRVFSDAPTVPSRRPSSANRIRLLSFLD